MWIPGARWEETVDLYRALQSVLDKIKDNNDAVAYATSDGDKLKKVMENQERIAEGLLLLGGLLQALLEKEITVQLVPDKQEKMQ
jgi:hypothetical protein